ncbi:Histone deacetylase domain-containing protein [Artemisia annua]|uniref:Histone deacetylase domain-containing protein n=1 Tax=Artemisia annua TaxID=35608 RepID=A0A2U1NKT3_ARTAN|nr:Histone deacetylase domain-containing protein [Artemisia annua]
MSKASKKQVRNQTLNELKEGNEGPIVIMICRTWDVHNINGRYLSTDFVVSDERVKIMSLCCIILRKCHALFRCVDFKAKEVENIYIAAIHTKSHINLFKTLSSNKKVLQRNKVATKYGRLFYDKRGVMESLVKRAIEISG